MLTVSSTWIGRATMAGLVAQNRETVYASVTQAPVIDRVLAHHSYSDRVDRLLLFDAYGTIRPMQFTFPVVHMTHDRYTPTTFHRAFVVERSGDAPYHARIGPWPPGAIHLVTIEYSMPRSGHPTIRRGRPTRSKTGGGHAPSSSLRVVTTTATRR